MLPKRSTTAALLLLILSSSTCPETAQQSNAPVQENPMRLVGKKLLFRYESGLQVTGHYTAANEVAWEALTGPAKGSKGIEAAHMAEVAPDVFFVNWVEKSGTTVSQVLDLKKLVVTAFVTFDTPAGRRNLFEKGTLAEQK